MSGALIINDAKPIPLLRETALHAKDLLSVAVITRHTKLLDREILATIDSEMDRVLVPMSHKEALGYATMLLAAYPRGLGKRSEDEGRVYMEMLAKALATLSRALAGRAIDVITARHPSFLPSRGEVLAVVMDLRGECAALKGVCLAMRREHRNRQDEMNRENELARDRARQAASGKTRAQIAAEILAQHRGSDEA